MKSEEEANSIKSATVIAIERAMNPWTGFTKTAEEEERSVTLGSVDIRKLDKKSWKPIGLSQWNKEYLLYRNEEQRVLVLNNRYFKNWKRLDATKNLNPEGELLGEIANVNLAEFPSFIVLLLKCHLVRTYWHMESELKLIRQTQKESSQTWYFSGVHRYYTNQENVEPIEFGIRLEGKKVFLVGR